MRTLHKILAISWLLLVLLSCLFLSYSATRDSLLRTDIFSFLPEVHEQKEIQSAVDLFSQRNSRRLVLLLTASSTDELIRAANYSVDMIVRDKRWTLSPGIRDAGNVSALWKWYQTYAGGLLSPDDREQLLKNDYAGFLQDVMLGYVSPMTLSGGVITQDPLFLLQNFLSAGGGSGVNVRIIDGWPLLEHQGRFALVLPFSTTEDVYNLTLNGVLAQSVYSSQADIQHAFPDVQVTMTGPLLHVFQSVAQSEREVTVVGAGSLVAIFLLFVWWLRSPLPLIASLLVLASGMLLAFTVMVALFGSVHLIALVFCSTIIGMGIDYSLHYFAHRRAAVSAFDSLKSIAVPTGLGMLTSALAFLVLAWVPFPGFRQVAIMAGLGLVFVWISMVLWLPYLSRDIRPRFNANRFGGGLISSMQQWLRSTVARVMGGVMLIVLAYGAISLEPDDDIRQLQAVFPPLKAAEMQLQQWLNQRLETAYFMVQGDSQDQLLTRMEMLCDQLRNLASGSLDSVQCLTDWLPGLPRQQQNNMALKALADNGSDVWQALNDLGLQASVLQNYRAMLAGSVHFLHPDQFWQGPASGRWQALWLGEQQHKSAAVVLVAGVRNHQQMQALAASLPDVYWVDQVEQFNTLFKRFRQQGGLFVLVSYCVLLGLLSLRYGIRGAFGILWPVLLAVFVVVGLAGLASLPFNLFSVLALILVAGMGIDYGIFMNESKGSQTLTLTAVIMSAVTTLLAFGLLALSKTTAISSFGQVVLVGISVVLLCTLLTHSTVNKEYK